MVINVITEPTHAHSWQVYAAQHLCRAFASLGYQVEHSHMGGALPVSEFTVGFESLSKRDKPFADIYAHPHFHLEWKEERVTPTKYQKVGLPWSHPDTLFIPHPIDPEAFPEKEKCFAVVWFHDLMSSHLLDHIGCSLHIFGEHEFLYPSMPRPELVQLHHSLPFIEHFRVLQKSHTVILDRSKGSHPWFLPALFAGCVPLIPSNAYYRELLGEDAPFFYTAESLDAQLREPFDLIPWQRRLRTAQTWERCAQAIVEHMQCA